MLDIIQIIGHIRALSSYSSASSSAAGSSSVIGSSSLAGSSVFSSSSASDICCQLLIGDRLNLGSGVIDTDVCVLTDMRAVVVYRDSSDANKGKAALVERHNDTFVVLDTVTFESGSVQHLTVAALSGSMAVVGYRNSSNQGAARVLYVPSDAITVGSEEVFYANTVGRMSAAPLDATHAALAYTNVSGNVEAVVLGRTGTTLSAGSSAAVCNATTLVTVETAQLDSTHAVVAASDSDDNTAKLIALETSGTTVSSVGSEVQISDDAAHVYIAPFSADKVAVAYSGYGDVLAGVTVLTASVSGTAITADGNQVTFDSEEYYDDVAVVKLANQLVVTAQRSLLLAQVAACIEISGDDLAVGATETWGTNNSSYLQAAAFNDVYTAAVGRDATTSQGFLYVIAADCGYIESYSSSSAVGGSSAVSSSSVEPSSSEVAEESSSSSSVEPSSSEVAEESSSSSSVEPSSSEVAEESSSSSSSSAIATSLEITPLANCQTSSDDIVLDSELAPQTAYVWVGWTDGTQNEAAGQTFEAAGSGSYPLLSVGFSLLKVGSPTGNAVAKLYAVTGTVGSGAAPTGAALATSDTFDVSTLSTTRAAWVTFTFATPPTLIGGTGYAIVLEYTAGDASNYVRQERTASGDHAGDALLYQGSWSSSAAVATRFKLTVSSGEATVVIPAYFDNSTVDALQGNLLHYWKFEEASGNARVDAHGANDLTDHGWVPTATGISGDGINVTTNGDYLSGSEAFRNKSAVTVSLWVKFDTVASTGGFRYIFRELNSGGSWVRFSLQRKSAGADNAKMEVYWYIDNSGTGFAVQSTNTVAADTWYNMVVVADAANDKIYLYVNGSEWINYTATGMLASEDAASASGIQVGGYATYAVDAVIDEMAIWDVAPSNISNFATATYNSGAGRFYGATGTALSHDAAETSMDAGVDCWWRNESLAVNTVGAPTVTHQYADYSADQGWADADTANTNASWNGSWLSTAAYQASADTGLRVRYHKVQIEFSTAGEALQSIELSKSCGSVSSSSSAAP